MIRDLPIGVVLQRLPKNARDLLNYAHEHELPAHICLKNREYIGVNTSSIRFLQPITIAGVWSTGLNMGPVQDEVILE